MCLRAGCLLDVALVIDHSGSIRDRGVQNWGLVIGFVKEIVSALNIGEHLTHMAAVSFGNRATLDFTLNQYLQRDPMIAAVERIRNRGGNTNTTGGLRLMRTAVFTPSGGDRPSVPNLCILITDGMPTREVDKLAAEVRGGGREGEGCGGKGRAGDGRGGEGSGGKGRRGEGRGGQSGRGGEGREWEWSGVSKENGRGGEGRGDKAGRRREQRRYNGNGL